MDFTVLERTPKGCSSLYACRVEETEGQTAKEGGDSEKREREQDMIRLSLVINLSEAVRTFFFLKS